MSPTTHTEAAIPSAYFVQIEGRTLGPFSAPALRKVAGFTLQTPVRSLRSSDWKPAYTVVDLKAYFAPPVRANSFETAMARTALQETLVERVTLKSRRFSKLGERLWRGLRMVMLAGILIGLARLAADLSVVAWPRKQAAMEQSLRFRGHQWTQTMIRTLSGWDRRYFAAVPSIASQPLLPTAVPTAKPPVKSPSKSPVKK